MADWMEKVQEGTRGAKEFVEESWVELMKVHWPSARKLRGDMVVMGGHLDFDILGLLDLG